MVFIDPKAMSSMLKANPLPLGHKIIFLMPFSLDFDPVVEDSQVSSIFIRFPLLPQVYQLLDTIGV